MGKRWRIRLVMTVAAFTVVLGGADIGSATHVERNCGRSAPGDLRACVRPILENINVFCFTNVRSQPACGATARVGAEGTVRPSSEYADFYVRFSAGAMSYNRPQISFGNSLPAFAFSSRQGRQRFYPSATITRNLRAPYVTGFAGGCLTYTASFFVFAEVGYAALGDADTPIVTARHLHGKTAKTYCVPQ